tara:strand:- start:513 stop:857 length:345 start_codon:yes stop_codon:yes gene_type:complete
MIKSDIKKMLTPVIEICFKYMVDSRLIKPKVVDNVPIGFTFKGLKLTELLLDKELIAIREVNKETQQLNINHGKEGSQWVDKRDNNKVKTINSDFFYVGVDTRKSHDSIDDLFA